MKKMFVMAMAKHLPPSAAQLRLLDIGGETSEILSARRADIAPLIVSLDVTAWAVAADSIDAVTAYDTALTPALLAAVLRVMRAGGRFILVNPLGKADEAYVKTLEQAGYVRWLVEPAIHGQGVLIRGEKPHTTADTLARVQVATQTELHQPSLTDYKGRFVYLLIQQTPNKPAWRLTPEDVLVWQAVVGDGALLAFSSLPKAVSFMQAAVLAGTIRDVNKVAKFTVATAQTWTTPLVLNPTLEAFTSFTLQPIDPQTAETPDE